MESQVQNEHKILRRANLLHFNRTVQRFGSKFMGLPNHKSAIGKSPSVNLKAHCDTVVAAAKNRPTVSDGLDVLVTQCARYIERQGNLTDVTNQLFHQGTLIDSAFIVYDMHSLACQKFNGDLGCSWLDDIHCYSDRDQISFPSVLTSSGLNLAPRLQVAGQEFRDRVYVNEYNVPMVHIAKRSCHWYYRSFSRCIASEGEEVGATSVGNIEDSSSVTLTNGLRVAVIVAGTLQRFMFSSTVENLIGPMVKSNVVVDYYASLTTVSSKAYRSGNVYMDHIQPDPTLPKSVFHDSVNIEEYTRESIGSHLASVGALTIHESIDIDSEPMLKARRQIALKKKHMKTRTSDSHCLMCGMKRLGIGLQIPIGIF